MSVVIDGTTGIDTIEPTIVPTALNASGSAPLYAARAWVNFNGTGTVAIRASGNVSSITDNGTGNYTVNFTTAMSDTNYSAIASVQLSSGSSGNADVANVWQTANTSQLSVLTGSAHASGTSGGVRQDVGQVNVAVFR